jgi:predicted Zn-dependent peptidase
MFTREILKNGVKVVTEKLPNVRSLSIGIWVGTGSRNESSENSGISHFIEHMLFKGTEKRSAKDIAEVIDAIGGQINAFTGKEATCYYTKTLDTHYKIALDVLSDMFFNSTFTESNMNLERGVILEEIGMYQDSLEELVHDVLTENTWSNNSLGMSILGTSSSLEKIDRNVILKYLKSRYTPQNTVISVAGNFDYDEILNTIKEYFENWNSDDSGKNDYINSEFQRGISLKPKDSEQTHICMGLKGIEYGSDELYPLLVVNNIFGGGMSSTLFQKIREEKGLANSVYSFPSSYKGMGIFSIYAGLNSNQTSETIKIIMDEINNLRKNVPSESQINASKEQLKGNYILGLEGTGSRMTSIGKSELLLGKIYSPDEILSKIDNIDMQGIKNVINKVFDISNIHLAVVGNIKKDIDFEKQLGFKA